MLSFIAFVGVKIAYIYPLKTPPDDNVLGIGLNQPVQLVAPPNSPVCLISISKKRPVYLNCTWFNRFFCHSIQL